MKKSKASPRKRLLLAIEETGSITAACQASGVGRRTFYDWRDGDEAFAAEARESLRRAVAALELEARRRAIHKGSDALLVFLLKAHRPKKYRDNVKHEHSGAVRLEIVEEIVDGGGPADGAQDAPAPPGAGGVPA